MFAENDTFGSNVNVSTVNLFLFTSFRFSFHSFVSVRQIIQGGTQNKVKGYYLIGHRKKKITFSRLTEDG